MTDITMCTGKKCEKATKCYRFMAHPNNLHQSWMDPEENKECVYFIPYRKEVADETKRVQKAS